MKAAVLTWLPLLKSEWKELKEDFGEEKVNYYFSKIDDESKMFDLDMDELFEILELDHFCLTTAQPEAMVSFSCPI